MSELENNLGPEVPVKKSKKVLAGLGIAVGIVAAGVIAVAAIGPAKIANSMHMLGKKTSYYQWVEKNNTDGLIDYIYAEAKPEKETNVTVDVSYVTDPSKIASTIPLSLSATLRDSEEGFLLQVPKLSKQYMLLESDGKEFLQGMQYLLPGSGKDAVPYIKKYFNQLISDSVRGVSIKKNQTLEINGVSVKANLVSADFDTDHLLDELHDVIEDMKIDEKLFAVLEKNGIKKSEFKSMMTELSGWAKDQKEQVENVRFTIDCYVDNAGKIVGRQIYISERESEGMIRYLLLQNDNNTDIYVLAGAKDQQHIYVHAAFSERTAEGEVSKEDTLSPADYVKSLDDTSKMILTGILDKAGLSNLGFKFGLIESPKVEADKNEAAETVIELCAYVGIRVETPDTTVTDSEISEELDNFVEHYSDMLEIKDRTKVQDKDYVNMDYTGRIDGKEFEGGSDKDAEILIGSHSFVDGFEEALIGHEVGSTVKFEVTFPNPYEQNEELSGKKAEFEVKINKIGKRELTDEFIAANSEYKTVAEYREKVHADLIKEKEYDAKEQIKSDLMAEIIKDCTITSIDSAAVKAEYDSMLSTYESYAKMYGIDLETFALYNFGLSKEDFYDQINYYSEYYVKEAVILDLIAKAEKLELSEDEYQDLLQKTVDDYGYESTDALEESYGKDELNKLFLHDKVYDFLIDHAVLYNAD